MWDREVAPVSLAVILVVEEGALGGVPADEVGGVLVAVVVLPLGNGADLGGVGAGFGAVAAGVGEVVAVVDAGDAAFDAAFIAFWGWVVRLVILISCSL